MEKQFIPYELALELKKLGFDEECLMYWNDFGKTSYNRFQLLNKIDEWCQDYISAPLWQQAFDWLWFKTNKYIIPILDDNKDWVALGKKCKSYQEARLECLKKLIEIVKTRK